MNDKAKIMIVDDSPEEIHLLISELKNSYQLQAATSADEALQLIGENNKPDVILMDVNMPGINGYEACRLLKKDAFLSNISVIFLSANDSTDEIICGLDAGAIDYIVKPYNPKILRTKIESVINHRRQQNRQFSDQDELFSTKKLANAFMVEANNLDTVVNFFRSSIKVSNVKLLTKMIGKSIENNKYETIVMISNDRIFESWSSNNDPGMLELELMGRMLSEAKSFSDHGKNCFVTYANIVVLIKNMPEDETECRSLKNRIIMILEGAQARLDYITQESKPTQISNNQPNQFLENLPGIISDFRLAQETYKKQSIEILDNMVSQIESAFYNMGLTAKQEEHLLSVVSASVAQSLENIEADMKKDESIVLRIEELIRIAKNPATPV